MLVMASSSGKSAGRTRTPLIEIHVDLIAAIYQRMIVKWGKPGDNPAAELAHKTTLDPKTVKRMWQPPSPGKLWTTVGKSNLDLVLKALDMDFSAVEHLTRLKATPTTRLADDEKELLLSYRRLKSLQPVEADRFLVDLKASVETWSRIASRRPVVPLK
jgi:hypothetical protein